MGVEQQLFFGAYKVPNHFVYGYSSAGAEVSGFTRGDAEWFLQAFTVEQSLIIGHQAIPILQTAAPLKGESGYSLVRKVPTLAQFVTSNPPKTKDGKAEIAMLQTLLQLGSAFDVPVGTPAKLVAALNAAIEFAATRGGAKAQLLQVGLAAGWCPGSSLHNGIVAVIKQQAKLGAWLAATGAP